MAAGLGFKTFVTGEVLTAGDTNGYLMQGINVFASTAARDAAITSPQEGQFAYTKDTNSLWYYTGSAWAASGATGDIEGVTAGVGISGGGTSGTVTVTNSMATAIDAKGDLVAGTGADAFSRIAVGANNTVLTADSAQATGLKWATVAATGTSFSLLNAGGTALTAASTITISGITGIQKLYILVEEASTGTASDQPFIRFNADTGSNYIVAGPQITWASTYSAGNVNNQVSGTGISKIDLAAMSASASSSVSASLFVDGCNGTGFKYWSLTTGGTQASSNSQTHMTAQGIYEGTSVITSVSITGSSNFDNGTIFVFGSAN